jgi:tRNA-dihydrouridine synthase B
MKIGSVQLSSPFVIAPMAGMTDSAFRRLVKRQGGCGLVVTEMVSSEGLVRGIDRTLEYAEYTEEERPVSIQIFGGDPGKMAAAAQIVEGMGADIVDVNMGCPVPKIAKHNAGCSLMKEPEHAATVINAMAKAVKIPVTVKMRAGWNDRLRNAPELARLVSDIARDLAIPVLGSGDCLEPAQIIERFRSGVSGVLVGRGVLRNPWILAQAADMAAGRPPREVTLADRGQFLLDYIDLLMTENTANTSLERWVINKLRALCAWYSKGIDSGSHLRVAVNGASTIEELRHLIHSFFCMSPQFAVAGPSALSR